VKNQEKKYRVESFEEIVKKLQEKGAIKIIEKTTMHYYAELTGYDVVKLVSKTESNEIHILNESDGKFSLIKNIPVDDVRAGLQWLRDKNFTKVGKVKMVNTNYEYKGGIVGLYIINDFLHSVILAFPEGAHEAMEKEFGLQSVEVINLPYNKHLEKQGKLIVMDLSEEVC